MTKILAVGDPHLSNRTPLSRKDDFERVSRSKLIQVLKIAEQESVDIVIFLGDIFHHREIPYVFYNKIVSILKSTAIPLYSIVGNTHDIPFNNIDFLHKTPLGALFQSGVLIKLNTLKVQDWTLVGGSVGEDLIKAPADKSMLFAHYFYEFNHTDELMLSKDDIIHLGYQGYVLGHDHIAYDPLIIDNRTIIRPGSMLRGTSHKYNFSRKVGVAVIELTDIISVKTRHLDILPAEDVYRSNVVEYSMDMKAISLVEQYIDNFMADSGRQNMELYFNNIYKYIEELGMDNEVKVFLEERLKEKGILKVRAE